MAELTDRVVYQRQHCDDLRVVPYNLQMMMDWDSHIMLNTVDLDIVCNIYINISSKGQHEKKELRCIQSKRVILMMRLNYSYMDKLYTQWGQCGIFMGIRTI